MFEDGMPLPPNIRPVIILQDSDYDIGYQYYQQIMQIFGKWVATHYFCLSDIPASLENGI